MPLTTKELFKLMSFLLIGATILVGTIVIYNSNRVPIDQELAALDLIPKPEKITELYFNDSANLPSSTTRNRVISFAFVIHNLETTDYQYNYEVSFHLNGAKHIVDSGTVLVKNNQYYVNNEKFDLTNAPGRTEVVVELINLHQSIDFWIGNT